MFFEYTLDMVIFSLYETIQESSLFVFESFGNVSRSYRNDKIRVRSIGYKSELDT